MAAVLRVWLPFTLISRLAAAASVQGTVVVPEGFHAEVDTTPSLWLLESGIVPITPPMDDPRSQMVIVLEGGTATTLPPQSSTVRLRDMRLDPRVVALTTGSSVEFKNEDRSVHSLYTVGDDLVPAQPQPSGSSRTIKFTAPGVFELRCKDVPHVRGAVLVLPSGRFAIPKSGGAFRIDDVPIGKYMARVWYAGEYLLEREIEVKGDSTAVELKLPSRREPEKDGT